MLLERIRLTLHSAVEVVRDRRESTARRRRKSDTVILKRSGDTTLIRSRSAQAV